MVLEDRNVSLRGRCKESDTLFDSCEGLRFWNLNLRISLRGQRKFRMTYSHDFVADAVLLKSETCFHFSWKSENARFRKSGSSVFEDEVSQKRSFWKSETSVFEEVSHKKLVLELRILTLRGSLA